VILGLGLSQFQFQDLNTDIIRLCLTESGDYFLCLFQTSGRDFSAQIEIKAGDATCEGCLLTRSESIVSGSEAAEFTGFGQAVRPQRSSLSRLNCELAERSCTPMTRASPGSICLRRFSVFEISSLNIRLGCMNEYHPFSIDASV
jgi:hypothetical protein